MNYFPDFEEFLIFRNEHKKFFNSFIDKDKNKNEISYIKFEQLYDEYIHFGGFPRVVLERDRMQKNLLLKDIYNSYFEKDVQRNSDFKYLDAFQNLITLLLQRTGSKIDVSKLSRAINHSRETVYSYLNFLKGTYFIFEVSPFTKIGQEVSLAKKIYVCDNGFLNIFGKIPDGMLFENAVYLNLRKHGKLFYYQRRKG